MFSTTIKTETEFCTGIFTFLLTVLHVSSEPVANFSASLAEQLCNRHYKFQETLKIQPPLKFRPENDESSCGSYLWTKCEPASCSSPLPLPFFVHKSCEKIVAEKTRRRKGKKISLLSSGVIQEKQNDSSPCVNSSSLGLPRVAIVPSTRRYPSLVTIERGDRCQSQLCTGLILNENWVIVTQAGCFYHYEPDFSDSDDFVIVAGRRKMYTKERTEQRRSVAQYIPHPGYKAGEFKYYKDNIGLVHLSAPFEFNEHVQPIDLKAIQALAPTIPISKFKLVGWLLKPPMLMSKEAVLHSNLIEAPLDYVPTHKCYDKKMEEDGAGANILICAGGCLLHGDEKNQPLRNVLFAQVKFKSKSKSIPIPVGLGPMKYKFGTPQHGVFVNLVAYISWMNETIHGQSGGHDKGQGQSLGQKEYDYHSNYEGQDDEGHTTQIPEPEVRIIQGENAPPHKYKSIVNLEIKRSYACHLMACAGVILNEHWFLTAAHCVGDWEKAKIRVIVGDRDTWRRERGEQAVSISKVIIHENWNASKYTNDIAVVKVTPRFRLNYNVREVTLPDPAFDTPGPFTAAGWALTEGQMYPQILEEIVIPFVSSEECASQFLDEQQQPEGNGQICAGNSTHGICKTPSGGFPLFHINEFGDQLIVGLGSYGGSLCEGDAKSFIDPFSQDVPKSTREQSTVFTKVTSYLDWIRKNAEIPEPIPETSTTTTEATTTTTSTSTSTNPTESSTTPQNKDNYKFNAIQLNFIQVLKS